MLPTSVSGQTQPSFPVMQMLQDELQRFQDAERWRGITPEQKQQQDRDRWRSWLTRYTARLGQEAAAGTSSADCVRVMNSTNPRCVLDNAPVNALPCSSHCVAWQSAAQRGIIET